MDPRKISLMERFPSSPSGLDVSHNPMISIEVGRYLVQYHFHRRRDMVHFSRRTLRQTDQGPRRLTDKQSRRFGNAMVADDVMQEPGPLEGSETFIYRWCRDDYEGALDQLLELERRDVPVEYDCGKPKPPPAPHEFDPERHLVDEEMVVLTDSPVHDLGQLEGLDGIRTIHLDGTPVTDLSPLVHHDELEALDLSRTKVSDLGPLGGVRTLRKLDVSRTSVTDLGPLAGAKKLRELDVSRTSVTDLGPLAGATKLRTLYMSHTSVTDLEPLAGAEKLHVLYMPHTPVDDVGPLSQLPALYELHASHSKLTDLSMLESEDLHELDVSHTAVSKLPTVMSYAERVDVSYTEVRDLTPLSDAQGLREVNLSHTPVRDVRALKGKATLATLNLSHTPVRDVRPLVCMYCLEELDLSHTRVKIIETLPRLGKLRRLDLSHTRVRDFTPLLKLPHLERVLLWGCTIRPPVLARLVEVFGRRLRGPFRRRWQMRLTGVKRRAR